MFPISEARIPIHISCDFFFMLLNASYFKKEVAFLKCNDRLDRIDMGKD